MLRKLLCRLGLHRHPWTPFYEYSYGVGLVDARQQCPHCGHVKGDQPRG